MTPSPAPGLLNDWITFPGHVWLGAFLLAFLALMVYVARIVREDRLDAMDDEHPAPVNYRCWHGLHFYRSSIVDGARVWDCSECGDRVVSGHGWVGDEAS